ncbi:MAG: LCP family protein [Actinobacteria bacterium]|nr:LCP family protein [Actinomycetota bacterium]
MPRTKNMKAGVRPRPKLHYFVLVFNIFVVCTLVTSALGLLWINGRINQRLVVTLNQPGNPVSDDQTTPLGSDWDLSTENLDAENFLLTGSDNGACTDPDSVTSGGIGDRTSFGERSDTIMLIRIDPSSKRAAILSFPRDLWVDIAGTTGQNRINSAFQSTDPNRLVATIRENFDIPVDHYVNINFCAFKEIVTAVDGVKVPFAYPTRDRKTGFNVAAPGCINFDGDTALAYVRSRSGYRYFNPTTQKWLEDPTGDLGRIKRQQDFLRRSMQRALDKGSKSLSVANDLLNAAIKNVITDDKLTPRGILTLAQAMRDLNTQTIATYTIDSYPKRIGEMSVLIPALKTDEMKQVLAIFQGRAPLVVENTELKSRPTSSFALTVFRVALAGAEQLSQKSNGVVPPNDPECR